MDNKKLLVIAVSLIPFVVISFSFNGETNFILENKDSSSIVSLKENEKNDELEEPIEEVNPLKEDEIQKENYSIKVLVNGTVKTISLEDYIVGVVAGEMPASFNSEALKAQAVASRTYALYRKSRSNGVYDLTDNVNNQVYIEIDDMKKKWGSDFDKYYNKIKNCVKDTEGEILTYNGSIIEAFYFAMSGGSTQEASTVFNESRDYLKSVESKYDNNSLRDYEITREITIVDFVSKLSLSCTNFDDLKIEKNDTGYVQTITLCSKNFKGTQFRTLLGLRSTNFDINIGSSVKITTRGYGHGVGMSQYGANGYANVGYTYEDILKHYYTGVELRDIKSV